MRLRVASSLSNSWAKEPIEAVDSGRRCRKTLREPVSVNSRTSLRSAEMEIGKWRAETGARSIEGYHKYQILFSQGEPADAVFYVESGKVKVSVASEQGKEAVVAMLGTNDFFGEGCL